MPAFKMQVAAHPVRSLSHLPCHGGRVASQHVSKSAESSPRQQGLQRPSLRAPAQCGREMTCRLHSTQIAQPVPLINHLKSYEMEPLLHSPWLQHERQAYRASQQQRYFNTQLEFSDIAVKCSPQLVLVQSRLHVPGVYKRAAEGE